MLDWLEKKLLPPQKGARSGLPALMEKRAMDRLSDYLSPLIPSSKNQKAELPNATVIYACGAAALFGASFFHLFSGRWITGLLILLPAGALLGFALHYLRYPD